MTHRVNVTVYRLIGICHKETSRFVVSVLQLWHCIGMSKLSYISHTKHFESNFPVGFGFVSSDRSSYSDDGLLYIRGSQFFRFSLSPLMHMML